MSTNLTAVLYKANDLRLEDRAVPEPKDDEVLLKMGCVGICGSDLHYLVRGGISDLIVSQPMVMGHEGSGTVVNVGKNVKTLSVGDRVAIEPVQPCRECSYCKEGKYNLCPMLKYCAFHGNLSQYYTHAAAFCFKLADNVSLEEGALLQPFSIGVHACKRAGVCIGSVVLVLGTGPIGLVTIIVAKAMGAKIIIATDLLDNRLILAKKCGADIILKVGAEENVKEISKVLLQLAGENPDKTIDCCGVQATIQLGIEVTKPGGTYVLVGMGANDVNVPLIKATVKEIDIRGSFRSCNDYGLGLVMLSQGTVNLKQLVTHTYKLEETLKAFERARTQNGNPIKILIYCN